MVLHRAQLLLSYPTRIVIVWAVYGVVTIVHVAGGSGLLPQRRRQISREVLTGGGPRFGPLRFGFELGTGIRTYLPTGLPYVAVAMVCLLVPSWWLAVIGAGGFGVGRALLPIGRVVATEAVRGAVERQLLSPLSAFLTMGTALVLIPVTDQELLSEVLILFGRFG